MEFTNGVLRIAKRELQREFMIGMVSDVLTESIRIDTGVWIAISKMTKVTS